MESSSQVIEFDLSNLTVADTKQWSITQPEKSEDKTKPPLSFFKAAPNVRKSPQLWTGQDMTLPFAPLPQTDQSGKVVLKGKKQDRLTHTVRVSIPKGNRDADGIELIDEWRRAFVANNCCKDKKNKWYSEIPSKKMNGVKWNASLKAKFKTDSDDNRIPTVRYGEDGEVKPWTEQEEDEELVVYEEYDPYINV